MGRHSTYTEAIAAEICERISTGETLRSICRSEGMPSKTAVYGWMDKLSPTYAGDDFSGRFARARLDGFDAIADETMDIADDATNDFMDRKRGDDVDRVFDAEHVQRSKLRIETRLKLLAKWDPKRYGEKQDLNITGTLTLTDLLKQAEARRRNPDSDAT